MSKEKTANQARFEELLLSTQRKGISNLIEYLRKTDFYEAPASTRFHSSYEGGLLEHSLNVYNLLAQKIETDLWSRYAIGSGTAIIVALLHDICKANYYKVDYRNAKNENGEWVKVPYYTVDDKMPYGHGEKSVMIASEFIKLTAEEKYAIRWHMGFSEPKENWSYVGNAMEKYPLVLALHQADMEATHLIESDKNE